MPSPESLGFIPEDAKTPMAEKGSFAERWAARNYANEQLIKRVQELAAIAIKNDARRDEARAEINNLKDLQKELSGDEAASEAAAETFLRGEIKHLNDRTGGEPTGADAQRVDELLKQYSAFHKNLTEN
jgi:hypothetical protein